MHRQPHPVRPALHPARLLGRATLADLPAGIGRPSYDLADLRPGIVHLGVGGFHRAHQAVYLDRLAELDSSLGWSVTGVGLRSCGARDELLAQDGLYTVIERDDAAEDARVVGVLRDYLSAHQQPGAVRAALSDPRTRLVTLTVTAPTYGLPASDGDVFALLARACHERRRRGAGPLTVLSCDNLPRNGDATRRRVLAAAARVSEDLAAWIERCVAFPNSMVDRITPPPSASDHKHLRQRYGVHDRAPVVTERFAQWVVEDAFAGDRPALEEVGVQLTTDVAPFVDLKTRVLNGAHLAIGFLSRGSTHTSTDEVMTDRALRPLIERMLLTEVAPGLPHVPGIDLRSYRSEVLGRLTQPALADPLARLRRRGSVRMAGYLVPSLEAAVAEGRDHEILLSVVAGWVEHLADAARSISAGTVSRRAVLDQLADPAADRLLPLASRAALDVRPFLAAAPGFERLRKDAGFTAALQRRLDAEEKTSATAS